MKPMSVRALAVLVVLFVSLIADKASAGVHGTWDIRGNVVLVDEIYLAIIGLPADAKADQANATLAKQRIGDWLRATGYALAVIDSKVEEGHIRLDIDEGRLARIVLHGKSPAVLVAYRARIQLPGNVFNRHEIERILARFYPSGDPGQFEYELVQAQEIKHEGPQLNIAQFFPGQDEVERADRYELHIDLSRDPEKASGARLSIAIDNNGYRIGGGYTLQSLLANRDRTELDLQLGMKRFDNLEENGSSLSPNRILGRVRYYSPPVKRTQFRPFLELREDFLRRQRQDLAVQSYYFNRFDISVNLSFEPKRMTLTGGFGVQMRNLAGIDSVPYENIAPQQRYNPNRIPDEIDGFTQVLPFLNVTGVFNFDELATRSDRLHKLTAEARYFFNTGGGFTTVFADYQKVFDFGWNDLWLTSNLGIVAGQYSIADAIPMSGTYLRGVYSDQIYMDRVLTGGIEYRVSLTRDLFKIGAFAETGVLHPAVVAGGSSPLEIAQAFGPGLHTLVLDNLQIDFYLSFGISTIRPFDSGATIRIHKAF